LAIFILAALLISTIPVSANIQVGGLALLRFVEIAKITVPDNTDASIQKTSINNDGCVSVDHALINKRFWLRKIEVLAYAPEATTKGWKHYTPAVSSLRFSASPKISIDLCQSYAGGLIFGYAAENISRVDEINCRFPASVKILHTDIERLADCKLAVDLSISGPNPCALRSHVSVVSGFSVLGGGSGLFARRVRQLSVGLNDLFSLFSGRFHFFQLVAESYPSEVSENHGQKNEKQGSYADRSIFLFISIFDFCLSYLSAANGVNRGGYLGGCIIILGLSLQAIAVCSFFCGFCQVPLP
jgi:hypothetical protein